MSNKDTLTNLIKEGKNIFKKKEHNYSYGWIIKSSSYLTWLAKTNNFLDDACSRNKLKNQFSINFPLNAEYITVGKFEVAISVLEAIKQTDSVNVEKIVTMDSLRKQLQSFISDGKNILDSVNKYNEIESNIYIKWLSSVKIFLKYYCSEKSLIGEFDFSIGSSFSSCSWNDFDKGIKILELIEEEIYLDLNKSKTMDKLTQNNKIDKIFISHATKDKDYIKLFVQLLNDIGIPKSSNKIFCSSLEGYNIPLDHDIYEYIKSQFDDNIRVIFMLSKNYYNSVACLNEMGATWINSKEYTTLFLPEFIPENIKGAINPNRIGFYLDDYERLNSFRDKIIKEFDLKSVDQSIWERDRNKFIVEVKKLIEQKKSNNSTSDVEMKIESVEEDHEGNNILLCTRIINNSQFNYKLKEFDLFLTDTKDEKEEITHKEHLEIYSYENRIINFQLPKRNQNFKGNRTKDKKIDPIFTK